MRLWHLMAGVSAAAVGAAVVRVDQGMFSLPWALLALVLYGLWKLRCATWGMRTELGRGFVHTLSFLGLVFLMPVFLILSCGIMACLIVGLVGIVAAR